MKRLKKLLKWTAVILGALVAFALIANAYLVWTTGSRLEQQLSALRAAGEPLTLADLKPKPVPPDNNAATYLRQAEAQVEAIENTTQTAEIALLRTGNNRSYLYPMPPRIQKIFRTVFDANPKAVPLIEQAAACSDHNPQLNYSASDPGLLIADLLPTMQQLRADSRVLQAWVFLLVAEGKHDEAMQAALANFRLSTHFERCPGIASYIGAFYVRGIAIHSANLVLQVGSVSKRVRDALDDELAAQERMEGYVHALKSDRALTVDYFAQPSFREYCSGSPFGNCWLIGRWVWNERESKYLDKMQSLLDLASKPIPCDEIKRMINEVDSKPITADSLDNWDFSHAIPITSLQIASCRAAIRCLRVLNALQTHMSPGSDTIPKLTELGLPPETTTDPFNGEPLHVKKTPQGWLVYSVGWNFKDDGGKLDAPNNTGDVGIGPPPTAKSDEPDKNKSHPVLKPPKP